MNKLAGHLRLQDAIKAQIDEAKTKIAAAKGETKTAPAPVQEKTASAAPKPEKLAGVIDARDPDQVEKLASALDFAAESLLTKEADSIENGGEKKQGGEQLPTQSPTPGKQPYKKDAAKTNQIPNTAGAKDSKLPDNPNSGDVVQTNAKSPAGFKSPYPAEGPLRKKASVQEYVAALASEKTASGEECEEKGEKKPFPPKKDEKKAPPFPPKGEEKEEKGESKAEEKKEKESSAAEEILGKLAGVENGGESKQGGEQLSNTAPVPSNPGRSMIANNAAPAKATKREAKAQPKKDLKEVLTEPAQTKSTDSKVHENLRNATKGGVKIAASRAFLQKVAEEGCQCDNSGSCRNCKLKKAMAERAESAPAA